MNIEQAKELLQQYQAGLCTDAEKRVIEQWLDSIKHEEPEGWMGDPEDFGQVIRQQIDASIAAEQVLPKTKIRKFGWIRLVAAAMFTLLCGSFVYYFFRDKTDQHTVTEVVQPIASEEIVPGSQGAILTLGDGTKIVLDSAGDGSIASQSNVAITQKNGQLIYAGASSELIYNTVTTPRGRQFRLRLSDGTVVWLNAGSSIRYPAGFSDTVRSVEVSGEAYFEVATKHAADGKNKIPFRVQIMRNILPGALVEVTGTTFNINAYPDEATTRTTLIEGGVMLKAGNRAQAVKPGQQGQCDADGDIRLISKVNIAAETAWRNGFFYCDETTDIQMVMRQLCRWYDIEVVFQDGKIPNEKYWGEIPREASLQTALKVLEMSGIKFNIEGRKVIVGKR